MAEVIEPGHLSLPGTGGPAGTHRRFRPDAHARALGLLLLRAAAIASVIAGVITFVIAPIRGTFSGEFEDFGAYLGAAHAVANHSDLYAQFIHQHPNVALSGFDYPPVVAFLVQPLAWVPATAAAMIWLWLTVACTAAATGIAAFTLLPRAWPRLEISALVTFLFSAATYNYWHGQMNPVIFLLLALALHAWVHERQTRFGVLVGIAASIKLAPIVLVILVIRRRWWRAAGACAVTVAAGLALGVAAFGTATLHEYVTRVLPVLSAQDGWLYNQSISGVASRLFGHAVLTPQSGSLLISVLTYAVLARHAWPAVFRGRSHGSRPNGERRGIRCRDALHAARQHDHLVRALRDRDHHRVRSRGTHGIGPGVAIACADGVDSNIRGCGRGARACSHRQRVVLRAAD